MPVLKLIYVDKRGLGDLGIRYSQNVISKLLSISFYLVRLNGYRINANNIWDGAHRRPKVDEVSDKHLLSLVAGALGTNLFAYVAEVNCYKNIYK